MSGHIIYKRNWRSCSLTDLSSVGRAEDCSVTDKSLGRWFESGWSEIVSFISGFVFFFALKAEYDVALLASRMRISYASTAAGLWAQNAGPLYCTPECHAQLNCLAISTW
jgi:hypothetical protein